MLLRENTYVKLLRESLQNEAVAAGGGAKDLNRAKYDQELIRPFDKHEGRLRFSLSPGPARRNSGSVR